MNVSKLYCPCPNVSYSVESRQCFQNQTRETERSTIPYKYLVRPKTLFAFRLSKHRHILKDKPYALHAFQNYSKVFTKASPLRDSE